MEAALRVREERAELLAGNVANADTPGYVARDIDFEHTLQRAIAGDANGSANSGKSVALENLRYDRNDIDASQQLAKSYENSLNYVATLKLYGDSVERLKSATSSS